MLSFFRRVESTGHSIDVGLTNDFVSALDSKSYPAVFSKLVIAASSGHFTIGASARRLVESQTSLWDPHWRNELTLTELILQVKKRTSKALKEIEKPSGIPLTFDESLKSLVAIIGKKDLALSDIKDFELVSEQAFLFRSKTDKNIRRTRLYDACLYYSHIYSDLSDVLYELRFFDQISIMNILYGRVLLSDSDHDWYVFMQDADAFNYGIEGYTLVAKAYSDLIKTRPSPQWMLRWVETAGFTGYRNPPYPGFDYVKETENLVSGDPVDHTLNSLPTFTEILHKELTFEVSKRPKFLTFKEFVTSGMWTTSGSSNIGRMELDINGEIVFVKARKNILPDIIDMKVLYEECMASKKQSNKSMIKSELGKVRIASSSDIHNYLLMSWVDYLLNHSYADIEGATIDERPNEQINRLIKMTKLLNDCYTLPFDYKNFDHQATTPEILDIVKFVCSKARKTVPQASVAEFDVVVENILSGFNNAFMSTTAPVHTFKVISGLCSGLRWTSLIGNIWNTVITKKVQILCERLCLRAPITDRFIRGDDSAIYTRGYYSALLVRMAYTALGVLADDNKFGILYEKMEFLRQFYTRDRIYAYPARNIPGLSQRKPWSSTKWDPNDTMNNLFDLIQLLKRRGLDSEKCELFWKLQKKLWSMRLRLPEALLNIPVALGGIGIEPWDGKFTASPLFPKIPYENIRIVNSTDFRFNTIKQELREFITIDSSAKIEALQKEVRVQQASVVVGDDIVSINRMLRDMFNAKLAIYRTEIKLLAHVQSVTLVPSETVLDTALIASIPATEDIYSNYLERINVATFGSYPYLDSLWKKLMLAKRIDKTFRPMSFLKEHYIDIFYSLTSFQLRHLNRSDAIDWLSGNLFGVKRTTLNPLITPLWTKLTAATIKNPGHFARKREDLYYALTIYAAQMEKLLLNSQLHQTLLQW